MYFLFILFGWILGISSMGSQISLLDTSIHPLLICSTSFVAILLFVKIKTIKQHFFRLCMAMVLSVLSFSLGHLYADRALDIRLANRITHIQDLDAIIYVDQISQISNSIENVDLSASRSKQKVWVLNQGAEPVQWLAYLNENQAQVLKLGHYYQIQGQAKPAHSYAVDGVFDQEKWFIQENISATFTIHQIIEIDENELNYSKFIRQQQHWISKFKLGIEQKRLDFRTLINVGKYQNQGLMLALLTGDESLLSKKQQDQFKRLGISHLLAISGPHVLIFASLVIAVFSAMINRFYAQIYLKIPKQYLILLPFCCAVWIYTAFVGFEIPAIRTLLTVLITAALLLSKQSIQPLKTLLISASILLLYDPFSILSAAFWLSYGACFILLRIYQTIQKKSFTEQVSVKNQIYTATKVLIESQWKVFIALMPLVILIFKQVSWVAPISNLFAIPLIGAVVVPVDIVAAMLSFFSDSLASFTFHLVDFSLSILMSGLDHIDQYTHAHLTWFAFNIWTIVCFFTGIFILFLPKGVVPKFWAILCFLPIFLPVKKQHPFEMTILDVGQGQAVFLELASKNIMIDTGGYYDEEKFSVGEQIIVPYLMRQGISKIDQLILSHLDQDHSGAFDKMVKSLKINEIYSSEYREKFSPEQFKYCYAGQKWQYDQVKIEILHPDKNSLSNASIDRNENSCVVYIQVLDAKVYQNFLIMGDAGWDSEYQILEKYPDLKVDVLVLGHHGSQHSSSYDFLAKLKPKLAIASAGYNNRYHHPTPIVIQRLKALNIPFISTIEQGSIHFVQERRGEMKLYKYRDTLKWLKR